MVFFLAGIDKCRAYDYDDAENAIFFNRIRIHSRLWRRMRDHRAGGFRGMPRLTAAAHRSRLTGGVREDRDLPRADDGHPRAPYPLGARGWAYPAGPRRRDAGAAQATRPQGWSAPMAEHV